MNIIDIKHFKMIVTDMDGTLLRSNGHISEYTADIINKLYDMGYLIVLNSGRPLVSILNNSKNIKFHYAIGMNGQLIYNNNTKTTKYNNVLKHEDIKRLYALACNYHVVTNLHDGKTAALVFPLKNIFFALGYTFIEKFRWIANQKKSSNYRIYTNIDKVPIKTIGKVCFAGQDNQIKKLKQAVLANYDQYNAVCVSANWLEVSDISVSKGNAIRQLAKLENIDPKLIIGFGDGENDISLLEACEIKVAMNNAMDSLKKIANIIIESNNQDGVAKFLEKNILDKKR